MEETYAIEIPRAVEADARRINELAAENGIENARASGRSGCVRLEAATYDNAALLFELCSIERACALAPLHGKLSVPITLANLPRRAPRLDAGGRQAWVFTDGAGGVIATLRPGALAPGQVSIEQTTPNASGLALARLFESEERREQLACACSIASDPFGAWLLGAAELSRCLLPGFIVEEDGDMSALMKGYWLLRHGVAADLSDEHEKAFQRARSLLPDEAKSALANLVPRRRDETTALRKAS